MIEVIRSVESMHSLARESELAANGLFKLIHPEQLRGNESVAVQQVFWKVSKDFRIDDVGRQELHLVGADGFGPAYYDCTVQETGHSIQLLHEGVSTPVQADPFHVAIEESGLIGVSLFDFFQKKNRRPWLRRKLS